MPSSKVVAWIFDPLPSVCLGFTWKTTESRTWHLQPFIVLHVFALAIGQPVVFENI